jgi:hypothetical protein
LNLDTPIRILELLGLSGLISIAVTMIANARRDRRNTCQRNYAHYSKRYADLMAEILLHVDILADFDRESGLHRALALRFFMLLSEEEYLASHHLIDTETADGWQESLSTTMRHPFFKGAWTYARGTFAFRPSLADAWIDRTPTPPTMTK